MNFRKNYSIILPIAISFYTFQIIGYIVDRYKGIIKEKTNFIDFSLFIFFFPQQLAGPILKASEFFPRLYEPKEVSRDDIEEGIYFIILGILKKGIFADSLAYIINPIYANPSEYNSYSLFLAILGFLFQLWGDFSGYSDIAIGCGKLLGFDFPNNFSKPFFSIHFSEMWIRWHITLSRFLRDYIYFPLGGSKYGELRTSINTSITMLIAGIWHGADWNFIIWGVLISISLILERQVLNKFFWWREDETLKARIFKNVIIFIFWIILAIVFRVESLYDIEIFLTKIFTLSGGEKVNYEQLIYIPIVMMIVQYYEYNSLIIGKFKENFFKSTIIISAVFLFVLSDLGNRQIQFIYFQF